MKKILFMITKSENGGAQKWTKEQIQICSSDFECYLATDKNGWLSKNVTVKDRFLNSLIYKRFSLSYLLELNRFSRNKEIDLIVASSANAGIYSRLIKLLNKKVKIIYVSHGWSSIYNGGKLAFLYTFIERRLAKISDSILCISKKDYNNAKEVIGINDNKLKLITNKIYPINSMKYNKDKKIRLLTVARLNRPKRVDLLIEATRNLDNIELHIVGDGILRESLELIKHQNVFFYGEIDAFNDFSSYDIFVLISDSEGLPLSALEAMSTGLPIILSDVGGCFELIDGNGVLVKNEIQEISQAIRFCSENLEVLGMESKFIFDRIFNLELNKNLYLDYYNKILKREVENCCQAKFECC